jgi:formylglycine-generating enzyme required for sulfatase activity
LQPLLTAPDHRTRAHVITVLRVLGETALPLLQAALADPAPLVRVHAIRALEYLATVAARHTLQHELVYEVAIPATDGQPRFYIDRYPVRNGDYQMFLADQPAYPPPPAWIARTVARDRETHPVTGITWDDAQAYATWAGKRLPTAAEWVQAAGGEHQPYPWGNTFHPDRSNTCEAHLGTTTPVDRYAPASNSVYGVADMAGNVWEWLADPAGPDGSYRQLRGGGWMYSATFARIDFDRCWRRPDQRQDAIGFRLCFDATREENDQ